MSHTGEEALHSSMSTHSNKHYLTALTPNKRPKKHPSYLTCEVLIKISLSSFVFCHQRCGMMKNWQKANSVADYITDQTHRWPSNCNKPDSWKQNAGSIGKNLMTTLPSLSASFVQTLFLTFVPDEQIAEVSVKPHNECTRARWGIYSTLDTDWTTTELL